MIGIVGYTGFVGLNLLQFYKFDEFYNSKNFETIKNKHFEILFFCGIPAVKWYANKNPKLDFDMINNIKNILSTITCNKFILISTIDVYDVINSDVLLNEDYQYNPENNHTYGKNRLLFENFIIEKFKQYHIIRLPALFGKGLKKNIIYDLINNNQINNISLKSFFQWYNLDRLCDDIKIIINNNINICNLFSEPLQTIEIVKLFDKIHGTNYEFQIAYLNDCSNNIIYNISTKYAKLFDSQLLNYICTADNVLNDIELYLKFEKLNKTKLCVSNICTNQISQLQFSCILKLYGIRNVQIAPTKLLKHWNNLHDIDLSMFTNNNLNIYSFQSIMYGLDNLNIFDENTNVEMFKHVKNIINCAIDNNVKVIVFGCPKNRKIIDTDKNNEIIFINFFKTIGDYCDDKNITICLENNSKIYGCNFINTIESCAYFVKQIDKKNIKMMVDLGNAIMENDSWYYLNKYIDIIYNIDISHEYMENFENPHESNYVFNLILKNNSYNNNINLEMLIKDEKNELPILTKSLYNFIKLYAN
jgi:hypothetical protein